MTRILLGNIAEGTSEEEIKDFLQKYGFPAITRIEPVAGAGAGAGARPSVLLTFDGVDADMLRKRKERIHGIYWKGESITARVLSDGFL